MIAYLDSSVILRRLFGEQEALADLEIWEKSVTSELAHVETHRALERLRLSGEIRDIDVADKRKQLREILDYFDLLAVDKGVLARAAESFPTQVKTLDAIHLASAILFRAQIEAPMAFLTHDIRLGTAAQALDFEVHGTAL